MNRVLIVEDEKPLLLALRDNLESEGLTVDFASNGEEAMEHIKENTPDLILLDLLMPKKDGFYVLEEVRKNPAWKDLPIIVLSNLGGDVQIVTAGADFSEIAMYANDYLVKSQHPIEEVIKKVKEHMAAKLKV